jgi:hypothetical protein
MKKSISGFAAVATISLCMAAFAPYAAADMSAAGSPSSSTSTSSSESMPGASGATAPAAGSSSDSAAMPMKGSGGDSSTGAADTAGPLVRSGIAHGTGSPNSAPVDTTDAGNATANSSGSASGTSSYASEPGAPSNPAAKMPSGSPESPNVP